VAFSHELKIEKVYLIRGCPAKKQRDASKYRSHHHASVFTFSPSAFYLDAMWFAPCSLPIHSLKRSALKVKRSSSEALCFYTFRRHNF